MAAEEDMVRSTTSLPGWTDFPSGQEDGAVARKDLIRSLPGQEPALGRLSIADRLFRRLLYAIAGDDGLGRKRSSIGTLKIIEYPAVMKQQQQEKK